MERKKWFAGVVVLVLVYCRLQLTSYSFHQVWKIPSIGRMIWNKEPLRASEKLVLFYTTLYESNDWGADFSNCPYKCRSTVDKKDLNKSHAVLVGLIETTREWKNEPIPRPRDPALSDQIWVFAIYESPGVFTTTETELKLKSVNNIFNWSRTYRRDSDIGGHNQIFVRLSPEEANKYRLSNGQNNSIQYRRQAVALISRCNAESERDIYIRELLKFMPVDVYGECGNRACSRDIHCYQFLGQKYKFWLSFENSICKDYVTEKFYRPFKAGVVPVVLGYGPYSEVAPAGSYIDVKDFSSPQALAKYLLWLDQNDSEYLKFFEWKKHFKLVSKHSGFWCNFCKKLHTTDLKKNRKWYKSVDDWYRRNNTNTSMCLNASEYYSKFLNSSNILDPVLKYLNFTGYRTILNLSFVY